MIDTTALPERFPAGLAGRAELALYHEASRPFVKCGHPDVGIGAGCRALVAFGAAIGG
jgi:hypothetical protein